MTNMDHLLNSKKKDSRAYSLLLIGSPGVGKTAISKRYSENNFDEEYIQKDSLPIWNNIINVNNQHIKLQLTGCDDLQNNIMALSSDSAYMHYDGYILCYSIENKRSFEMINQFNRKLNQLHSNKPKPTILIANKCDILGKRVITSEAGNALASELHCPYVECSAKTGKNIQEMLVQLVNDITSNSTLMFSSTSFEKFIYWFEQRKKGVNRAFLLFASLHLLTSLGVLGVAYYQGICTVLVISAILSFALLVGLWDVVFYPIGIYSIIMEKVECLMYYLITLAISSILFLSLFIWQILIIQNDTERILIYCVYPAHIVIKLLLLGITVIIYQFKGLNTNVTDPLISEHTLDY